MKQYQNPLSLIAIQDISQQLLIKGSPTYFKKVQVIAKVICIRGYARTFQILLATSKHESRRATGLEILTKQLHNLYCIVRQRVLITHMPVIDFWGVYCRSWDPNLLFQLRTAWCVVILWSNWREHVTAMFASPVIRIYRVAVLHVRIQLGVGWETTRALCASKGTIWALTNKEYY